MVQKREESEGLPRFVVLEGDAGILHQVDLLPQAFQVFNQEGCFGAVRVQSGFQRTGPPHLHGLLQPLKRRFLVFIPLGEYFFQLDRV